MQVRKEILIFSKYFGYSVGGAEKSILELLKQKENEGYKINVLFVKNIKTFNAKNLKMELPKSWKIYEMELKYEFFRFVYFNYFLNKSIIKKEILKFDPNKYILYSYGYFAPAAINAFKGESVYLVRDEYGLGWNNNYYSGVKRILKEIYRIMEYPFYYKWKKDLYEAIKMSKLIANSKFIAKELKKISNKNIEIMYPYIDENKLINNWYKINKSNEKVKKGIVLIGDNILKGSDIVKKIAKFLPQETFYIFDRKYVKPLQKDNIVYMPWQKNSIDVYKYAKLVLVPSRWYEAFGRVSKECKVLDIPVIGSARGGIVEILDENELINDIENINEWVKKIKEALNEDNL